MSEEERKGKLWKCPVCGNSGTFSTKKTPGFQFYASRCCRMCNTIWNPGFDRLSAYITILVGFIIVSIFIKTAIIGMETLIEFHEETDWRGGDICALLAVLGLIIGLSLILYGIAVFAGKAGKATIFQQGTKKE
jgi:hypothetical protein